MSHNTIANIVANKGNIDYWSGACVVKCVICVDCDRVSTGKNRAFDS